MGSNVGAALGVIGIIIGAGAIGFAFFVWNGQNTTNSDLKSDIDDLTDQLNNLTGPTNITGPTNMTAAFNNLTAEFNNLTTAFNNLTAEFNDLPRTIVVGSWEGLTRNMVANPSFAFTSHWLFEFQAGTHYNGYYINLLPTRTYLVTAGWYRIHLSTDLVELSPSHSYTIEIYKNGINEFILYSFVTTVAGDPTHFYVDSAAFIYSDGTDFIEISGESNGDDFKPETGGASSRFTIEYVAI